MKIQQLSFELYEDLKNVCMSDFEPEWYEYEFEDTAELLTFVEAELRMASTNFNFTIEYEPLDLALSTIESMCSLADMLSTPTEDMDLATAEDICYLRFITTVKRLALKPYRKAL